LRDALRKIKEDNIILALQLNVTASALLTIQIYKSHQIRDIKNRRKKNRNEKNNNSDNELEE
jgi:hypothetical protein